MFNPNPDSTHFTKHDKINTLEKLTEEKHVIGFKSMTSLSGIPLNNPFYYPYYTLSSETGLPMLVHCSSQGADFSSSEMIKDVCKKFPNLKLILAHFGGLNSEYMKKAVENAEEFSNLYLNTTGLDQNREKRITDKDGRVMILAPVETSEWRQEKLEIFLDAYEKIPDKILYGSDTCFYTPESYRLWLVTELPFEDAKKVFLDNPKNLFGKKLKEVSN